MSSVLTRNDTTNAVTWAEGGGGGGAPTDSKYILQQPDVLLSNAQALSNLATGSLKNTAETGALSIDPLLTSVSGATIGLGSLIKGVNATTVAGLPVGSNGDVLTVAGGDVTWAAPTTGGAPTGGKYVVNDTADAANAGLTAAMGLAQVYTAGGVLVADPTGALILDTKMNTIHQQTIAQGDLLVGDVAANTFIKLAQSTASAGDVLTNTGTTSVWQAPVGASATFITKTDETSDFPNSETFESFAPALFSIQDAGAISVGDTLVGSTPTTYAKVPIGTTGEVYTVSGGTAAWAAPAIATQLDGMTNKSVVMSDGTAVAAVAPICSSIEGLTPSKGSLIMGSTASSYADLPAGTQNYYLGSNGAGSNLVWSPFGTAASGDALAGTSALTATTTGAIINALVTASSVIIATWAEDPGLTTDLYVVAGSGNFTINSTLTVGIGISKNVNWHIAKI